MVTDAVFVHLSRGREGGRGDGDETQEPRGKGEEHTVNTMFILTRVGKMRGGIDIELGKGSKQGVPCFVLS